MFLQYSRNAIVTGALSNRVASPREDLRKIVQAGIQAPSACNEQVVSFVIVNDPELLAKLAVVVNRPVCSTARAMIACVVDPRPVYKDLSFAPEDCAAAAENMLLAATALGYASVWLDGVLRLNDVAARVGSCWACRPGEACGFSFRWALRLSRACRGRSGRSARGHRSTGIPIVDAPGESRVRARRSTRPGRCTPSCRSMET